METLDRLRQSHAEYSPFSRSADGDLAASPPFSDLVRKKLVGRAWRLMVPDAVQLGLVRRDSTVAVRYTLVRDRFSYEIGGMLDAVIFRCGA
jgi:hypothetical protein